MKAWWNAKTARERALLALLGIVTAAVVGWYGVVAPLAGAQQAAHARYEAAAAEAQAVEHDLAQIARLQATVRPPQRSGPAAAALSESAAAAGLSLERLEPDPDGGLRARLEGVAGPTFWPWLATLPTRHGLAARHLTVLRNEDGALSVDATFVDLGR